MIQVGIQCEELLTTYFILQFCPWSNTLTSSIPALGTGNFRSLAQPEIARIQQVETIFLIPECTIFTLFLSIFTTYTDDSVFRQSLFKVFQLIMKYFLRTQYIHIIKTDGICRAVFTVLPVVQAIFRIVIANIETHDINGLWCRYLLLHLSAWCSEQR